MKRLFYIVALLLSATSCETRGKIIDQKSIDELLLDYIHVVQDSSSTWPMVEKAAVQLADHLYDALCDEDNLDRRVSSQAIAYETMVTAINKYYEFHDTGGEDKTRLDCFVGLLGDAIFHWFYDNNENYPNLWRDHYYVSDKEAENPIDGYFHLAVLLPTKDNPQPSLHIYYPETAEGNPMIMFRDFDEDGKEVKGRRDVIQVEKWAAKGEISDNTSIISISGSDVVEKMLEHEVMYISFMREHASGDEDGGLEIVRMPLAQFQTKWKEIVENEQIIQ